MADLGKGHNNVNTQWATKNVVAETVYGFVFWSAFAEFLSTLWFFPLNKMDFTGILFYYYLSKDIITNANTI